MKTYEVVHAHLERLLADKQRRQQHALREKLTSQPVLVLSPPPEADPRIQALAERIVVAMEKEPGLTECVLRRIQVQVAKSAV